MSLKNKFILVGIIILLSMVGIFSIGQYTVRKVESFDEVNLNLSLVQSGMLQLRRNEKDFLARKKLIYIDTFETNHTLIKLQIEKLYHAISGAGLDLALVKQADKSMQDYYHSLVQVFELQKIIGLHHNDGLYGALRESVHNAEREIKIVGDEELRADMLQLRRNEKDFMLRSDLQYKAEFVNNIAIFYTHLQQSPHSDSVKNKLKSSMQDYQKTLFKLIDNNIAIGLNINIGLTGDMRNSVHRVEDIIANLKISLKENIKEEIGSVDLLVIIEDIVSSLFALIVIAMLVILASSVLKPLNNLTRLIKHAAENNDLTTRIPVKNKDEIGETAQAFNHMLETFQKIIGQVNGVTDELSVATDRMSDISINTNKGIQAQREQTSELADSINEMVNKVEDIATFANEATAATDTASQTSNNGQCVINTSTESIKVLSNSIQDAAEAMKRVDEDSIRIGSVLEVIQGIAEQTNLLALNAAIEAARAGEQGRGFAVVADEVRTLAGSTQSATQEIQKTIESLQARSNKAVALMVESSEQVKNNVSNTSAAGDAFSSIVESVQKISDINQKISAIAVEQNTVMKDINQNLYTIDEITEASVAGSDETAQASGDLSNLAVQLKSSSSQFKS